MGFTLVKRKISEFYLYKEYGEVRDKIGMTIIYWNNEGHSCTYFGNKLNENISFTIEKDGGNRKVFDKYFFNKEDVKHLLELTM